MKYVRLYGYKHRRTEEQFRITWDELQAALPTGGRDGLLLGVSGQHLLVDGMPLESGQAERSFAKLLSAAGLASLQFSAKVTQSDFSRLVRGFALGGSKAQLVSDQIRAAVGEGENATIKINEIRYVAHDPATGEVPLAAQLAAQNLGPEFREWLSDPQKLLQLIAAAEGSKRGSISGAVPSGSLSGAGVQTGGQATAAAPAWISLQEKEVIETIRLLTRLGETCESGDGAEIRIRLSEEVGRAAPEAAAVLRQALQKLAGRLPQGGAGENPLLMKAAEHLAIRFALERYERGEVRVNAIHEMLERMSREMEMLRRVLRVHEDKMSRAGMLVESHADILDRQFWAEVPDSGKRSVLLSPDAPCVPPRNVRSFVEDLMQREDREGAATILRNYCDCVASDDPESRRKTATGVSQLADLYITCDESLLPYAIRRISEQLTVESVLDTQSLLSAAFVRISQEAGDRRRYGAVEEVLAAMKRIEQKRPVLAQDLRPRVGVDNRLPEFIEEALQLPHVPGELVDMLKGIPQAATEQIAERFARCHRREECDRLVELMEQLKENGIRHLRELLRLAPVRQAASSVGLLSRVNPMAVLELLPARLREWDRFYHDGVVRQIAASNAPERGQLLFEMLDVLDHAVLPQAIDEIGFSGDHALTSGLLVLADEGSADARSPFLRLKVVEALGRLKDAAAIPLLRAIVEARKMWKWVYPRELRISAAQALVKIEPQYGPQLVTEGGFTVNELELLPLDAEYTHPWVRQRRYQRIVPSRAVPALASSSWGRSELTVRELSLGGGVAKKTTDLRLGSDAALDLQLGLRHIKTQVMLRRARQGEISFEIVDMDLEERSKLRRILADQLHRISTPVA
ncbi:MAG TPA: hypothetical protein VL155_12435 [Terriglobales bacterium]|nr:hypothetical protein [Terriglobales bacterium]